MYNTLVCAGFGGQGVMTMGQLLSYTANKKNLNTLWFPSYGPETRGGTANCSVTISDGFINSPVISTPDAIVVLNEPSLDKFEKTVKKDGLILINSSSIFRDTTRKDVKSYMIPANEIALELGNTKVANMVMLGAYLEATKIFDHEDVLNVLREKFGEAKAHLIEVNKKALQRGKELIK